MMKSHRLRESVSAVVRRPPKRVYVPTVAWFVVGVWAIALACGGSDATGTKYTPPVSPPLPPLVTRVPLRAIAGTWAGVVTDLNQPFTYRVRITIQDSAVVNEQSGSIEYDGSEFPNPLVMVCTGALTLLDTSTVTYRFSERIITGTNCATGGSVRLYPLTRDTLRYEWYGRLGQLGASAPIARRTSP